MISYVLTEYHTWSKFAIRKQRTIVSNYIKDITYRMREHKQDNEKKDLNVSITTEEDQASDNL